MGDDSDREQDRVERALAAYLDHLSAGGPEPDVGHLTDAERRELQALVEVTNLTEGVAFGLGQGRGPGARRQATELARSESGRRVVAQLRETMPPDARLELDPVASGTRVGPAEIAEGWIVGTFGGRVRVWLLTTGTAEDFGSDPEGLTELTRIFSMFPDTSAIAVVDEQLTCIIIHPEDCAPRIEVPSGSLLGRRYRRSAQTIAEAVAGFLNELIPYWDPVPVFEPGAGLGIDVTSVGTASATAAIENQRGIGDRARKGNPKKTALLELGDKEVATLTTLATGLFDGSLDPDEVDARIERLAKNR
jgi:hypothetical protein